ncbi:MAG TPA: acyltransferase domain-containing protein [Mycobacteriales bacterium]|nr:acyltransferase domain-containing protein [Mycobacteriales bacterium]
MLALLSPGQGAQTPGFLEPWLDHPDVLARLRWYSAVVGRDLIALGTTGSEADIRDTAACQPLLVATALAVGHQIVDGSPSAIGLLAGHSVGELAVAALSGALTDEAALTLVRERGEAMAEASAVEPTGMSAVLGGDPELVVAAIESAGLFVANRNGAGQIVAAGDLTRLAALPAALDGVARVMPLQVAGAFHTSYMSSARKHLADVAAAAPVIDPRTRVVSNADGAVVSDGRELLRRLVDQVAAPVRWDVCLETLAARDIQAVVELPPAGTLSALVKRALPGVETLKLRGPEDLAAARALLATHGAATASHAPSWRVIVAPSAGTLTLAARALDSVAPGARVATLEARAGVVEVVSPHGGVLVEWLAADGDPVKPGQPLARMHPGGAEL